MLACIGRLKISRDYAVPFSFELEVPSIGQKRLKEEHFCGAESNGLNDGAPGTGTRTAHIRTKKTRRKNNGPFVTGEGVGKEE